MLKLLGHGLGPQLDFELDPSSGRYTKRRLKWEPESRDGYAGFCQELKVRGLGHALCSAYVHQQEIFFRIGESAWNLFQPGLELTHDDGIWLCELCVSEPGGKRTTFRYRRKDTLLLFLDSTYDNLDFEIANFPPNLLWLAKRDRAEMVAEWSSEAAGERRAKTLRELRPHWDGAWSELGLAPPPALFDELAAAYREPHRAYHTLRHLQECFALFAEARRLCANPAEVALALWFHDAVYQPKRRDSEEASAAWAEKALREAGAAAEVIARVRELILATRHEAQPASADARVLVDIDLSILAADAPRFDEYETQVRTEYAHVADFFFRRGRAKILKGFLARPSIYSTAYFRDRFEARARANLQRRK